MARRKKRGIDRDGMGRIVELVTALSPSTMCTNSGQSVDLSNPTLIVM